AMEAIRSAPPTSIRRPRHEPFADAGIFLSRLGEAGHEARLLFDSGGMGLGSGGHGHADALSFTWDIDDVPFLVDPGTFVYNRARLWRNYFRGTSAHNTVTVDGLDQSLPGGTFSWIERARVRAG